MEELLKNEGTQRKVLGLETLEGLAEIDAFWIRLIVKRRLEPLESFLVVRGLG